MSWLSRMLGESVEQGERSQEDSNADEMSPGLTGQYDHDLREVASMREPPVPPEHMGLQGEFDEQGLAKRVALMFDRHPELRQVDTVAIEQEQCTIRLKGTVPSGAVLDQMVEVASLVDGTKAVDTQGVRLEKEVTE